METLSKKTNGQSSIIGGMAGAMLFIIMALGVNTSSWATTYYVASNGDDNNNGTSSQSPWASYSQAHSEFSNFNAGDSLLFRRGDTFTVTSGFTWDNTNSTSQNPIVIADYGDTQLERPKIDVNHDGFHTAGFYFRNETSSFRSGFIIKNIIVIGPGYQSHNGPRGIRFRGSYEDVLVENVKTDGLRYGVQFQAADNTIKPRRMILKNSEILNSGEYGWSGSGNDIILESSYWYSNGAEGPGDHHIYLTSDEVESENLIIRGNEFTGDLHLNAPDAQPVKLAGGVRGGLVENNLFWGDRDEYDGSGNTVTCIRIDDRELDPENVTVKNNVMINLPGTAIIVSKGKNFLIEDNIVIKDLPSPHMQVFDISTQGATDSVVIKNNKILLKSNATISIAFGIRMNTGVGQHVIEGNQIKFTPSYSGWYSMDLDGTNNYSNYDNVDNNQYYYPNSSGDWEVDEGSLSQWQSATSFGNNSSTSDPNFSFESNSAPLYGFISPLDETESPPAKATSPSPANNSTDLALNTDLSWSAGTGATTHDVYFGTDSSPDSGELVSSGQSGSSYDPGTLSASTTYYWRIDEINSNGTTPGDIWTFSTGDGSVPSVSLPSPSCWTGIDQFDNVSINSQTGVFEIEFFITPDISAGNSIVWLSSGLAGLGEEMATGIKVQNGSIDAVDLDGSGNEQWVGSYSFQAGETYRIREVVDVPNKTYDAYITPDGGSEITLGEGLDFRSDASSISVIDYFAFRSWAGNLQIEGWEDACCTSPSITSQPQSQTKFVSEDVTFNVSATGTDLSYQWQKDGSDISGATTSSYNITDLELSDEGDYRCIASNSCDADTTNVAELTVISEVVLPSPGCWTGSNQFDNVSISNQTGVFEVEFLITPDISASNSIVWLSSGQAGLGEEMATGIKVQNGSIDAVDLDGSGNEQWVGSYSFQAGETYLIREVVDVPNKTYDAYITPDGGSETTLGEDLDFRSEASSISVIDYFAFRSWAGNLQIEGWEDACCTSPSITSQPQSQTKFVSEDVTFNVSTTGTDLSYQWQKDGSDISGATTSSYNITDLELSDEGNFRCIVINSCGADTSNVAAFTVDNNLLLNPGFENGTTDWTGRNCTLTASASEVYSGSYSGLSTNRSASWNGPYQTIRDVLIANGQGDYTISARLRLSSGSGTGKVTIKLVDGSGTSHEFVSGSINSSGWTLISGTVSLSWTGTLSDAGFYTETPGSATDFYSDDCVLIPASGGARVTSFAEDEEADMELDGRIKVFPVPAKSKLTVDLTGMDDVPHQYVITDIQGRRVMSGKMGKSLNELDIQSMKSGLYFLHLRSGESVFKVYRFIKD